MNNGIYDEKESFLLYTSFYGLHFADLSNEEKGVLIDCIFQYTLTGRTNFEELEEDRGLKRCESSVRKLDWNMMISFPTVTTTELRRMNYDCRV